MPEIGAAGQRSVEEYEEALAALHILTGTVLFEFARDGEGNRDIIIRNFIARSDMTARAVFDLWHMEDYQDCWVLHRCLLDRLFHLRYLSDTDSFDPFEAWSFLRQYKANRRILSDPDVSDAAKGEALGLTEEARRRGDDLSKNPPAWRRPKAKDVAQAMDMRFLYAYSYDFASGHVHPMANDGDQDFHTITGLKPPAPYPEQLTVLGNTVLIATMIVQEGLNASTLNWRRLVYDLLDDLRVLLGTGSPDYRRRLAVMVSEVQKGTAMCEPRSSSDGVDTA